MTIVGFSFTKMVIERKNFIKGKINIANNISIKNVSETTLALGKGKQPALKMIFEFVSKYNVQAWVSDGYINALSDYVLTKPKVYFLRLRNSEVIKYIISKESKNICFDFFRYLNSSDRRRVVTSKP